jgi:hypothetical protein
MIAPQPSPQPEDGNEGIKPKQKIRMDIGGIQQDEKRAQKKESGKPAEGEVAIEGNPFLFKGSIQAVNKEQHEEQGDHRVESIEIVKVPKASCGVKDERKYSLFGHQARRQAGGVSDRTASGDQPPGIISEKRVIQA